MKDVFIWNLSKGKKLEKVFSIAKIVFLALTCITVVASTIWNNTVFSVMFWIFTLCFYGCFIAEVIVWKKNLKCEKISRMKKAIETPSNMLKLTVLKGDDKLEMDVSGKARIEDIVTLNKMNFNDISLCVLGEGIVPTEAKDTTVAEIIANNARLLIIDSSKMGATETSVTQERRRANTK
jgi:hypothetical protein